MLREKFKDFNFTSEFPNLFLICLYESGGDFQTFSELIGYSDFELFLADFKQLDAELKPKYIIVEEN